MKAQITIWVIIGVLLAASIILTAVLWKNAELEKPECQSDADCVAAGCCHSKNCVPISQKPNCNNIICTLNIEPGDVTDATCICNLENKCVPNN